jgi:hypothetical protein
MQEEEIIGDMDKSKDILKAFGFEQTGSTGNQFQKANYKAVVWKDGGVTVVKYTPNFNRFLWSETFTLETLETNMKTFYLLNKILP